MAHRRCLVLPRLEHEGEPGPAELPRGIESRLGTAKDLDDFCRKAQFLNYENHRAMFEAWNAKLWDDASALLLWMSHPAWYSTVWQTYDYDFDVNGAYYGSRKASEPVHVQASPVDGQVIAVNHTPRAIRQATVTARWYDLDGRQVAAEQKATVDVAPSATAKAFTADPNGSLPGLYLLQLRLTDERGKTLAENTYWRYKTPEAMQALNKARQTRVAVDVTGSRSGSDGRRELTARVTNRGSSVAAMVRVSLVDGPSGHRCCPQYSDNYLWLLPGESRMITASWPRQCGGSAAEAPDRGLQRARGD